MLVQTFQQLGQDLADIPVDGHVRFEHPAELRLVPVNLGKLLVAEQLVVPQVAGALVEPGTKKDHQVGLVDDVSARVAIGGDTEATKGQLGPLADHSLGLEAGRHRYPHTLAQ